MSPYNVILGHLPVVYKATSSLPSDAHTSSLASMIRSAHPELGHVFYLDLWPFGPQMLVVAILESLHKLTQEHSLPKYHALKDFLRPIADGMDLVSMEWDTWKN